MWDLIIDKVSIDVASDHSDERFTITMDQSSIWVTGEELHGEPRKMPLGKLALILERALYPEK